MATKSWSDLSSKQKAVVAVVGTVQSVTTGLALRDLRHRPSAEIRGPKPLWCAATFVQPVGPLAYLVWGRRRG